jgi:RNAse (barnase) inhibitor barstar
MSESTLELLGPGHSGVYRAPADVVPFQQACTRSGCAWFTVDLAAVADKTRLLEACAKALCFPGTFGANWDALADCLQDFSWRPAAGYVIHLRRAAVITAAAPQDWSTALEILNAAAMYWKERGKAFVALVEGAADLPRVPA